MGDIAARFAPGGFIPKPAGPAKPAPATYARETFHAVAHSDSRQGLMDAMRAQAEGYFGCRVELREATGQRVSGQYRGTSRWVARP